MRHAHIPAMAHNHAHSFLSDINFVDRTLVADEIRRFVARTGLAVRVDLLAGTVDPTAAPDAIRRGAVRYRDDLPRHAASHGVTLDALRRFVIVIEATAAGLQAVVDVEDDRGVSWTLPVRQTAL